MTPNVHFKAKSNNLGNSLTHQILPREVFIVLSSYNFENASEKSDIKSINFIHNM